jgi:hypothetical protein
MISASESSTARTSAERGYLAALVAGEQVAAIGCERPGSAQVFYARSIDELRKWAEKGAPRRSSSRPSLSTPWPSAP